MPTGPVSCGFSWNVRIRARLTTSVTTTLAGNFSDSLAASLTPSGTSRSTVWTPIRPSPFLSSGVTLSTTGLPPRCTAMSSGLFGFSAICLRISSQVLTDVPFDADDGVAVLHLRGAGGTLALGELDGGRGHGLAREGEDDEEEHRGEQVVGERAGHDGRDARRSVRRWRSCPCRSGRCPRTGSCPRSARRPERGLTRPGRPSRCPWPGSARGAGRSRC